MSAQAARNTPWSSVVLLGAVTAMGPLAIDMYLPSLPAIGAELHATPAEAQSTVAAFLGGMAFGQLVYGPASDRLGRRPPLLVGVGLYVAASVLCALAPTAPILVGGRFLQALGACSGTVIARAIVRDRYDHVETARMLSLMMLIMGLAPIFAPLAGGALLGLGNWRVIFWVMSGFGGLLALSVLTALRESRSPETAAHARSEHPLRGYAALLGQKRLLGYALAGALNGATLFAYISSSPALLIGDYGIAPSAFGWVFGANGAGLIAANQVNRHLLRRRTPDEVLAVSSWVALAPAAALCLAAATGVGGRWSVLGLLFLVLASYGFIQGNTMAGALSVDPRRAGSIAALLGASSFAAGALSAWGAGALHLGAALGMALVMLVSLMGSTAALQGLALPRRA
jgi:DHA1 family bicyclomycin/chloramphenicol resistance-like MFS transporter